MSLKWEKSCVFKLAFMQLIAVFTSLTREWYGETFLGTASILLRYIGFSTAEYKAAQNTQYLS